MKVYLDPNPAKIGVKFFIGSMYTHPAKNGGTLRFFHLIPELNIVDTSECDYDDAYVKYYIEEIENGDFTTHALFEHPEYGTSLGLITQQETIAPFAVQLTLAFLESEYWSIDKTGTYTGGNDIVFSQYDNIRWNADIVSILLELSEKGVISLNRNVEHIQAATLLASPILKDIYHRLVKATFTDKADIDNIVKIHNAIVDHIKN